MRHASRILWVGIAVCAAPVAGQRAPDSVTVVAGAHYGAGALHRFLLGSEYRSLWTTPMRVPVLDLSTYAGGLTPTERGGGMQTGSLRLVAADGREFSFRSVDKDPSSILPVELRETAVDDLVQDQISSAHPTGALMVAPLLEAVGVLHAEPGLYVMPDDPRLGEFRREFAGMLGMIEVRPNEAEDGGPGFEGASLVVGTERVLERIEEDLERIDDRQFLAARLLDAFLGDWDRHRDQWRWARFGSTRDSLWRPIPRDRDQAFVRMDGLLLAIARQYYPQFVRFNEDYPHPIGLTWNGRELDRRLLVALEWPAWDSVARALQAQLTDEAIDRSIRAMPPELARLKGDELARAMRRRRDALPAFARRFYELLADVVEVHTTDADETAVIERTADGDVHVEVLARRRNAAPIPVFARRFHTSETTEIRLDLHGGRDSVIVRGTGNAEIQLRVLGGGSDDTFVDETSGRDVRFYDESGDNVLRSASGATIDARPWDFPGPEYLPSQPPRDWGTQYRTQLRVGSAPDVGLLAGLDVTRIGYGFRKWPFASQITVGAAFGADAAAFRAQLEARFHRENSAAHWTLQARVSGLDILRFYGFGNETPDEGDDDRFKVGQRVITLDARAVLPFRGGVFALGPALRYADTAANEGRLIAEQRPYGWGTFGQAGLRADLELDARDRPHATRSGMYLSVGGAVWPGVWDVVETYAGLHGEARAFATADLLLPTTLALRAGARTRFGDYPFGDAATIGDEATVRLGVKQRYAGDSEAHANAELRIAIARVKIVIPADLGVFGLFDVGRVWFDAETSGRWHRAVGGGLSLAFPQPQNALRLAVARAEGRTGIYLGAGFAY